MVLYIVSLIISLIVSVVLFSLFFHSLRLNWKQKNRRPISYLAPVILVAALIVFSVTQMIPRLLDLIPLVGSTLAIEEIVLQDEDINWISFEYQQNRYWYNRWTFDLETDTAYRISYTPFSHYVLTIDEMAETAVAP